MIYKNEIKLGKKISPTAYPNVDKINRRETEIFYNLQNFDRRIFFLLHLKNVKYLSCCFLLLIHEQIITKFSH